MTTDSAEPVPVQKLAAVIHLPDQSQPAPRKRRSGSAKRQRLTGVFVRLLPEEVARLEAAAAEAGYSVAAYLRTGRLGEEAVLRQPRRRPRLTHVSPIEVKAVAQTNAELNKIGSNLNQAVRALNELALAEGNGRLAQAVHLVRPIEHMLDELRLVLAATRHVLGHDRQG